MVEIRRDLDRLLPVFAAALAVAVALWASSPYAVGVFHDDGVYAILGKSIATGQGYRFLHLPGAPAATHYPPGYPLLLALVWKIAPNFPDNVPAFLFANALLLGAVTVGVYRFATAVLDWRPRAAAAVAIVATLSTPLLMLSSLVLSEPMFAALLFPVVIGAERLVRDDDGDTGRTVLVALGLGVLALVRTHAIALTIALLAVLVARRRWRTAFLCAVVTGATLIPWQLWLLAHAGGIGGSLSGSYGTYSAWLFDGASGGGLPFIARTILLNAREVGALFADHFAIADGARTRMVASLIALTLTAIGAWRAAKRSPVFVVFAVVYAIILLVWPFTPWRFVYAVWPAVVLFIGETVALVVTWRPNANGALRVAVALMLAVVCIGAVREETRAYSQRSWSRPAADATAQIAPLLRWVVARTNAKDVLAVDGEQLVFLFTGRRAVPVAPFTAAEYIHPRTAEQNAASLRQLIQDVPVDYIATISPGHRSSGEMLADATAGAPINPGGVKVVGLTPLAAGEAFRVDRAVRLVR